MNILVFALCVCIRSHENTRMDVLVQGKNHLTLFPTVALSGLPGKNMRSVCVLVVLQYSPMLPQTGVLLTVLWFVQQKLVSLLSTYTVFP